MSSKQNAELEKRKLFRIYYSPYHRRLNARLTLAERDSHERICVGTFRLCTSLHFDNEASGKPLHGPTQTTLQVLPTNVSDYDYAVH